MTTTTPLTTIGDLDSPLDVLVFARSCQTESDRAQANLLMAAVTWPSSTHPSRSTRPRPG